MKNFWGERTNNVCKSIQETNQEKEKIASTLEPPQSEKEDIIRDNKDIKKAKEYY